jgi:hypothetical protein
MRKSSRTSFSLSGPSTTTFMDKLKLVLLGLSKRARPRPQLRRGYESSSNRIVMNVIQDSFVFPRIPDPVIVRFMLPKLGARPAENPVGFPGRYAFDPLGHPSGRFHGHGEKMHMVGHDYVTADSAKSLGLGSTNNVTDDPCQARVLQPQRTAGGSVQLPIYCDKRSAGIGRSSGTSFSLSFRQYTRTGQAEACPTGFPDSGGHWIFWQRSCQPPSDEQPAFVRLPVREVAAVVGHGTGQAEACPTSGQAEACPTVSGPETKNSLESMRI